MEMVCGFAWFGWVMLGLLCLMLALLVAVLLLEVLRRWRHGCREYAAYQLGYDEGAWGSPRRAK